MNFPGGKTGTKVRCESRLFTQGKTPEFTKMGEIHELFVWALSLVWFAGATPDKTLKTSGKKKMFAEVISEDSQKIGDSTFTGFYSISGYL